MICTRFRMSVLRSRASARLPPDQPAMTVLRWSNDGVDDEERFGFRSVWLAWRAAHKLGAARHGA